MELSLVSRCQEPSPDRISTCVAQGFQPLPFFISGGPGVAGWILYRSASLVVYACCNEVWNVSEGERVVYSIQ